jgi:hypothetical protein
LTPEDAFQSAVEQTLSVLGESTGSALVRQLEMEGLNPHSKSFNARALDGKLTQLFGEGSQALMRIIYQKFMTSLSSSDEIEDLADIETLSYADQIEAVLKTYHRKKTTRR